MKAARVIGLTVAVVAMVALSSPTMSTAADRVLNGELVVLDAAHHRFRIVGYDGSFTAPAGVSIEALDGRAVEVQLANGRVEQIIERPVPIQPISHGFGTVRGQLVVRDELNRTFSFAGDDQIYTAPAGIHVSLFGGKMVEARLDENGHVIGLDLVEGSSAAPLQAATGCMYGGQTYSVGATTCQSGITHRCDGALWLSMSSPCGATTGYRAADSPLSSPRSCAVGDATVAHGSSICRSGVTFRCDDGAWINAGTACR